MAPPLVQLSVQPSPMPGLSEQACIKGIFVSHFLLSIGKEQQILYQQALQQAEQILQQAQQMHELQQRAGNHARFVQADACVGRWRGYVFKQGPEGLGYYKDIMSNSGDTALSA